MQRLDASVVAVGERLLSPTQTVLEAFPSAAGSDGLLHLTLFCPPTGHNHTGVAPPAGHVSGVRWSYWVGS